jgi:hypothetical protein
MILRVICSIALVVLTAFTVARRTRIDGDIWLATRMLPRNSSLQVGDLRNAANRGLQVNREWVGRFLVQDVPAAAQISPSMLSSKPNFTPPPGYYIAVISQNDAPVMRAPVSVGDPVLLFSKKTTSRCAIAAKIFAAPASTATGNKNEDAWLALQVSEADEHALREVLANDWILLLGSLKKCASKETGSKASGN